MYYLTRIKILNNILKFIFKEIGDKTTNPKLLLDIILKIKTKKEL